MSHTKKWKEENPIYIKLYKCIYRRAYHYRKRYKIDSSISDMLGCSLPDMIGCSVYELKDHIESKWTDGMCWENHGKDWEIDHIIPLSHDKTIDGFIKLNHHTNLQPLWKKDNREKGNKLL